MSTLGAGSVAASPIARLDAADGAVAAVRDERRDVAVLTSVEAVRALAPHWEAMAPRPGADPETFLSVVLTRPTVRAPWIVVERRADVPEAMLVTRLEEHDYRCRFAYQTVYRRSVRSLTVEHGGALRRTASMSWAPLVRTVAGALREGLADVVLFRRLDADSELLHEVRAAGPWPWRNESEALEAHWCLDLPESYDALLDRVSGRTRQTLRRCRRTLDRAFPGRVTVRRTTAAADVRAFCRRAETVARLTYQRGLDAGFVHDAEYETRLVAVAARGRLRAYELEVDGVVRAFWIGQVTAGTHHLDATAHASDFGRWSPGKVLRLEVLRDAIAEGVRRMDFGFGDAEYKRQFGARCWRERDVYLFAPGMRGAWLNAARSSVAWASRSARALAEQTHVGGPLRRFTRRALLRRLPP